MGALHEGHAALLQRCRAENDISVLSVFVNPTQFNDPVDLARYPRTLGADSTLAARSGVDWILAPDAGSMYPDGYHYKLTEDSFSKDLCGAHRPGHFDGVLSVVLKLFQLVKPHCAYFGEKDFQQLELIRGMVRAFFLDVEIVPVPTLREADGLAMSSRNMRLDAQARRLAPAFAEILGSSATAPEAQARLEKAGFEVDYVKDRAGRRFGAVTLGGVRLIDNRQVGS
jgi:pantoate--beta-alanine ligase